MVPGSTLMYGSSLMCVTRRPRASISAPIDAAARPLPMELTTPPVTKTNLVLWESMQSTSPRRYRYGLARCFRRTPLGYERAASLDHTRAQFAARQGRSTDGVSQEAA